MPAGAALFGLGAGLRPLGTGRLAALVAAGRVATRARDAWLRARDGFLDGLLEELTPEFPDPTDWVRHWLQGYDRRPCRVRRRL